jgi:excisionase family DNA binding protein
LEVLMSRESTILPVRDDALLEAAEQLLRTDQRVALTNGTQNVDLPSELRALLADVVRTMRRGQGLTIAPLGQRLTTQEAADLLGVSRPTLVKLLDRGAIPYEQPSRHRRLRLADVLAFRDQRRQEQRMALRDLARSAQDMDLYGVPPEEFESALAEARQKNA